MAFYSKWSKLLAVPVPKAPTSLGLKNVWMIVQKQRMLPRLLYSMTATPGTDDLYHPEPLEAAPNPWCCRPSNSALCRYPPYCGHRSLSPGLGSLIDLCDPSRFLLLVFRHLRLNLHSPVELVFGNTFLPGGVTLLFQRVEHASKLRQPLCECQSPIKDHAKLMAHASGDNSHEDLLQ